ncbi:MAG: SemiSWEET transporter [Saprospiraceae bacterium]
MDKTQVIGIAAGILTAISMFPQLLKILKEKKAENVSVWMLLILISGLILWTVYGILKKDWPIIITNAFSVLLNFVLIFFRHKYREK